MSIDRVRVKSTAKSLINDLSPHVYITAAEHMIIVFIMTHLLTRLSGFYEYSRNAYTYLQATGGIYTGPWPHVKGPAWAFCIVLYCLIMIINAGYVGYTLSVSRGKEISGRAAFGGFEYPFKAVLVGVLRHILISLGFAFFVIPGFLAAYSYRLVYYVLADHPEYSAIECLRECRRMSKGYKMQLFVLDLSFIGWHIINKIVESMFLPLVEIWLLPYSGITFAIYYNIISGAEYSFTTISYDNDRDGQYPWDGSDGE